MSFENNQNNQEIFFSGDPVYGENLYWGWSSDPGWELPGGEAVESWYEEKKGYNYSTEPEDTDSGKGCIYHLYLYSLYPRSLHTDDMGTVTTSRSWAGQVTYHMQVLHGHEVWPRRELHGQVQGECLQASKLRGEEDTRYVTLD